MDGLIKLLNKQIHIITAPVFLIFDTIRVFPKQFIVRDALSLDGIGIEIIIHVDTIHIISAHNVLCHLADIITILRYTRIQDKQFVVGKTVHRLSDSNMIAGQLTCSLGLCPVGIDPCMKFHTTFVTFGNHPLQRIPIRLGGNTLLTCQKTTPRLNFTLIKCITFRTDLEDDHVYAIFLQLVELISQRLLHLCSTHSLELSVDTLDPRATHFAFLCPCRHHQQKHHR